MLAVHAAQAAAMFGVIASLSIRSLFPFILGQIKIENVQDFLLNALAGLCLTWSLRRHDVAFDRSRATLALGRPTRLSCPPLHVKHSLGNLHRHLSTAPRSMDARRHRASSTKLRCGSVVGWTRFRCMRRSVGSLQPASGISLGTRVLAWARCGMIPYKHCHNNSLSDSWSPSFHRL